MQSYEKKQSMTDFLDREREREEPKKVWNDEIPYLVLAGI